MQEELSFLKLPGFLKLKDPRILSLKMFPVCYRMTKVGRFAPSSVRFLNWGTMSNGKCLTARISESLKQESGCISVSYTHLDVYKRQVFYDVPTMKNKNFK